MSRAILRLTNGEQIELLADRAEQITSAIQAGSPCVVFDRYEHGRWRQLTAPMTSIAYIEQAKPADTKEAP